MITKDDIQCYRTNYSKDWLEKSPDGYGIPNFPCVGAVNAIHALCDEVEALKQRIEELESQIRIRDKVINSMPLCPDHRDKFHGKPCPACECERLEAELQTEKMLYKSSMEESEKLYRELEAQVQNGCGYTQGYCPEDHCKYVKRVRELEAENKVLWTRHKMIGCEADALARRNESLEADLESETKWAKTYCDAFVKVREAAKEVVEQEASSVGHTGVIYEPLTKAVDVLKQALKDTESV